VGVRARELEESDFPRGHVDSTGGSRSAVPTLLLSVPAAGGLRWAAPTHPPTTAELSFRPFPGSPHNPPPGFAVTGRGGGGWGKAGIPGLRFRATPAPGRRPQQPAEMVSQ
ncbi:hypothetical protein U9M48_044307, partial [Paspalum notatum var. saurae]